MPQKIRLQPLPKKFLRAVKAKESCTRSGPTKGRALLQDSSVATLLQQPAKRALSQIPLMGPVLACRMRQPASTQPARLDQDADPVEDGDDKPSARQVAFQHLIKNKDGDGAADHRRQQPNRFESSCSAPSAHEKRSVKIHEADGKHERSDQRKKRGRFRRRCETHQLDDEDGRQDQERAREHFRESCCKLVSEQKEVFHTVTPGDIEMRESERAKKSQSRGPKREDLGEESRNDGRGILCGRTEVSFALYSPARVGLRRNAQGTQRVDADTRAAVHFDETHRLRFWRER